MCPSLPFGIEGRMWNVIVLIPDHCLSIYFFNERNNDISQAYDIMVYHLLKRKTLGTIMTF